MLRKGKERFVCDMRLLIRQKQITARGKRYRKRAAALREAGQCLDLDRLPNLPRHERRLICVPSRCGRSCIEHSDCRYRQYLKASNGPSVTIQVCNHNYLLADAAHRQNGWTPLLKDYQALVIDEAHKLPETVRQMNTQRISSSELLACEKLLTAGHCGLSAQKLRAVIREFLAAFVPPETKAERAIPLQQTKAATTALRHLDKAIGEILKPRPEALPQGLRGKLSAIQQLIPLFLGTDNTFVRYLTWHREGGGTGVDLCAVPFDLPKCLSSALWDEQKPAILTSGTLAVGEDFSHTEKRLGLDRGMPMRTLRVLSPFEYEKNCMLYFPESRRRKSEPEEARIARQIEELVHAANGHTLVLFTSYDQMGHVYEKLKDKLPLPVLQLRRNAQSYLQQFKQLSNAVLFASGACWEGVDFPGDMVSLLVIPRLPFPVPDPLGEALRTQYCNLHSYIRTEIVPEMQIKLRQGFGRAIRTETDSCVVAILDPRAAPGGRYHRAVLDALPEMPIGVSVREVRKFYRTHKSPEYFLPK